MTALLLLWQPPPQRVLLIGVGGGSIPRAVMQARPKIEIDAVDIDAAVVRVAQRYFGLTAQPQLHLHVADGREFVATARSRGLQYGAVLLDAFDACPEHARTRGRTQLLFGRRRFQLVLSVVRPLPREPVGRPACVCGLDLRFSSLCGSPLRPDLHLDFLTGLQKLSLKL